MDKAYKTEKPEFGHAMLKYYGLDPKYINLNNGSYGTPPKPVLRAAEELTAKIEANPDYFIRIEYLPLLADVRQRLATFVGAKAEEVVLVTNASVGLNTILRNLEWEEGDLILSLSTTYESVSRTIQYLTDLSPHLTSRVLNLNFPTTHSEIIEAFRKFLHGSPVKSGKKRVAVIDSIISCPGVLLPWKELVRICKEEGVLSIVDAAHSIGQEVGLNLTEIGPDFWISNCYKWLSGKRSSAVLYVPEQNQHMIKAAFPTSVDYISPKNRLTPNENFVKQFEWGGLIECAPYLTIPHALEFREWMGGEEKINGYCHDVALNGGKALAKVLGTSVMDPDGELTVNMVNVALAIPPSIKGTGEVLTAIRRKMLLDHNAFALVYYHNDKWWVRCSAQVWNEIEDFEKIGKVLLKVGDEIVKEFGSA